MTERNIMPPTGSTVPAQRAPEHTEEWALVSAAAAGDTAAFDRLYRANHHALDRHITRKVPMGPLAEDIAANVWMRAWARRQNVVDQGKPYLAWLFTIANNLIIDHHKAAETRLSQPAAGATLWPGVDIAAPDYPVLGALQAEAAAAVQQALDRLCPEQRRVMELRFLRDLSIAETAVQMGKNVNAIKALQFRASRNLLLDPALRGLAVIV